MWLKIALIGFIFGIRYSSCLPQYVVHDMEVGDDCVLKDGNEATCQLMSKCKWFQQNYKTREFSYVKDVVRCGFERLDEIICCPESSPNTVLSRSGAEKAEEACKNFELPSVPLSDHILEGEEVSEREFPFMAALGYRSETPGGGYEWNCGASVISDRFLLTAGHCVARSNKPTSVPVIARLGVVDLNDEENLFKQDILLKRIIPHESYSKTEKYNDIALIELEKPAQMTPYVTPICLNLKLEDNYNVPFTVEGWGFTDPIERVRDTKMKKVNLTVVKLETCETELVPENRRTLPRGITESMICTKGELGQTFYKDACLGDSGGPLQKQETTGPYNSKFFQYGIISFGSGCGNNISSVFTRVASYVDWIAGHVWP